ncbi:mRNA-decapping enzyme-like protein [Rhododendron vialii]|uniref:mRNA-decapping enzyme-like protein n=1 Tax=Rhododendron vialii TaxID=182163 RepID=UPI00265E3802|nr:mRNA-decapping enzyme-like protein [Rhododendron vialii]
MAQNGKLMPNLDQQSTKLLNLTVLQRIDPFVEEILITAAHVTFYEFNIDLSQWSRKDVEGSLFVVKRNAQPRFQFIVMNRRNTENLVENLLEDFEYEVQGPYLLYRNAAQEVNGIWFYNRRECEDIANLFSRILNAYSKVPPKSKIPSAKSEFEELEAVPTMAVMDGPLEPSSSTTSNVTDVPDDPSFVNFFSAAMTITTASNATMTAQPYQNSAATLPSHPPSVPLSVPTIQMAAAPKSTTISLMPLLDGPEISNNNNQATNLVKPSSFFSSPPSSSALVMPSVPSSMPASAPPLNPSGSLQRPYGAPLLAAPPLNPSGSLQRPYGAPLLQPFPPPTPPPSLTPTSVPVPHYGPVISRDKVRDALLVLVQDNQFIDMVYRALLNAHHS